MMILRKLGKYMVSRWKLWKTRKKSSIVLPLAAGEGVSRSMIMLEEEVLGGVG